MIFVRFLTRVLEKAHRVSEQSETAASGVTKNIFTRKKAGNTIPQNLVLMKPQCSFDASTHHSGLTLLCDNVGPALQRARSSVIDACCQPGAFAARA
jgi:hypothetical protein